MSTKFKAMKFWIGGDKELYLKIISALKVIGYYPNESASHPGNFGDAIGTNIRGEITALCSTGSKDYFDGRADLQEVNIDWMRTPKEETIELNGKKYLKSELEEALKHIKPMD